MGFEDYGSGLESGLDTSGFFLVFYLIYMLVIMALSLAQYILMSLGTYTMAKRRGIQKPWLAWIPIGSSWILGSLSDQYQYVVKGQVKNKRKILLVLQIVSGVAFVAFFAVYISLIVNVVIDLGMDPELTTISSKIISSVLWMLFLCLAMAGVAIATAVVQYMALYDVFRSCEPGNATLYLVLSILVSITMPIFLFICRNKEGGMPPRRQAPFKLPEGP